MSERQPFCGDAGSRRAFVRWCKYLADECGLELSPPDLLLVGALARAESRLEQLGAAVAKTKDAAKASRLVALEMTAQRAFLSALEATDRALGSRVAADAAETVTSGPSAAVARGRIRSVAAQRILNALSAGARLTKAELLKQCGGDKGGFLRALKELESEQLIQREGPGHRGRPFRYWRAS